MPKFKNIQGEKFNRLMVLKYEGKRNGKNVWRCKCDCGKFTIASVGALISGGTKSCGCLLREKMSKFSPPNKTHGMSNDRFYRIWHGIKVRCLNSKHKSYERYGRKGITMQGSWLLFENFKKDMYSSYLDHANRHGERNTTIDRINGDESYILKNCRWATWEAQQNNKNRKLNYELAKQIRTKKNKVKADALAKQFNVSRETIYAVWQRKIYRKEYQKSGTMPQFITET